MAGWKICIDKNNNNDCEENIEPFKEKLQKKCNSSYIFSINNLHDDISILTHIDILTLIFKKRELLLDLFRKTSIFNLVFYGLKMLKICQKKIT